ncbi:hypothetical protein B0H63DRAFT_405431 [Podospora didyma]|uniref:Uncharacterized protein n=1 Tax=Podospora didyma TaxID=330526 RepID=A0AAE0JY25_9PEZI|nr:hypothetical protein B0H63DRAFT_405431 [Podospora didyma]
MAQKIRPLVQVDPHCSLLESQAEIDRRIHPEFPKSVLEYWLLSEDQLDSIARFYDQSEPSELSQRYPCPILWQRDLSVEDKRRLIGMFIGIVLRDEAVYKRQRKTFPTSYR